jgi:ferredoxin-NADP reductase
MVSTLKALVHTMRHEARGIVSVELRPASPDISFPPFTAGSHLDLHLADGMVRSYSLSNSQDDRQRYVVTVQDDRNSRGGSRYVHERLRVGSVVEFAPPRNHFALHEEAPRSVLVAGGIGVTPIYAMLQRLCSLGRPVALVYCARSQEEAAFCQEITAAAGPQVEVGMFFDDQFGGPPNLLELLAGRGADTHYYCCGPAGMLAAFEKACDSLGYPHAHVERFAPPADAPPATQGSGYVLELQRSGRSLTVPPGQTILDTLLANGIDVSYSCGQGICGACETSVLAGEVDHRDSILSPAEQSGGATMMICVSGCKSGRLVLDL